jgi:hypothetical protein
MLAAIPLHQSAQTNNRKTSVFNGKVHWVQIDLGKDVDDHLISPEERLNLAIARQ